MTLDDHFFRLLGEDLRTLAPLIKAAVQVLDQKGSRALRYKIDGVFHCAVHTYNTAWRSSLPMSDSPMGNQVEYDRVIPLRSGRQKRRKATNAGNSRSTRPAWHEHAGLQLVVDNAGPLLMRVDRPPWLAVVGHPEPLIAEASRAPIHLHVDNDGGDHAA